MNIVGISGLHNSIPFKKRNLPNLPARCLRIVQGLDSAAALVTTAGIQAAAEEERFIAEKGTGSFPVNAIQYCLKYANLSPDAIDFVAHGFAYEPVRSFYEQTDGFYKKQFKEVYSIEAQIQCITDYLPGYNWIDKFVQVPHHLAHAASAFYPSGFEESLILVADGMGEMQSTTIAVGSANGIEIVKQIPALHSLGLFYGVFTHYLGFKMGSDEYKVMGLAPFGNVHTYLSEIMEMVELKEDGSFTIPLLFTNDTVEKKESYSGTLQAIATRLGPPREPGAEITMNHKDIAAALQHTLQACLLHVLQYFRKETGQSNLCMAGGVALNCTANSVIRRSHLFKDMFIQPAAGDDGSALGAALYVQSLHEPMVSSRKMALPLWGPDYSNEAVEQVLTKRKENCHSTLFHSFGDLVKDVAERISRGQVIAWFQGRMEFGPRALGNRSILADPRHPEMRDRINRLVKKREGFRPFAPSVTVEAASQYFELAHGEEALDAYMLFVVQVRENYRNQLPAITHVDGSARIQVVSEKDNSRFWALLNSFGNVTGMPILLNTSFNLRDQPIICSPLEAIETFLSSEIDALVIGDYLVEHHLASSPAPA